MSLVSNQRSRRTLPWPSDSTETGLLVRTLDWSRTPLGPVAAWPESLRSSVDLVLACSFPMILLWGPNLVQIYNDGYSTIMGAKHPQGMGQATQLCWPEVWEFNKPVYDKVFHGDTLTFENQLFPITRHGFLEQAYFTLCYSPARDGNGEIAGVLVTVFETTLQLRAEARQMQVELDLRQMIDSTPQIFWTADQDGRMLDLSRRWLEITGLAEADGLDGGWSKVVPPEDFSTMQKRWEQSLRTGVPFDVEHYVRLADGDVRWMRSRAHPSRDEQRRIVRWYGTTEDIHQQHLAEDALRANEERYRLLARETERQWAELEAVYRTAPIGLALFEPEEFRYVRLNDRQAAFFGMRPEQIVGQTLTQMAPIEGLIELFEQVKRGEPVINFPLEGVLSTAPDQHRYWLVSYFPVFAADGSVQGITAASLEITQQKKAELALLQSEKLAAVGRLAASIAHEINNPLESVTNLLYLAKSTTDASLLQEYLDMAERELRRVSVISNQTLRFYKQSTSPREVTCDDLLESVLSVYQGKLVNSRVAVEERKRTKAKILCFDGEIRQILGNLIGNAIDAMHGSGGRLLLRTRVATHWKTRARGIMLTIADTGTGMPPAVLERLFEAFYTTKGIGGNGLGLWISKDIVDRHQGAMRVRSSQVPGQRGTVFTLFLPFQAIQREMDPPSRQV